MLWRMLISDARGEHKSGSTKAHADVCRRMLQDLLDVEADASDVLLEAVLQIVAQVLTSSLRALLVQKYKN